MEVITKSNVCFRRADGVRFPRVLLLSSLLAYFLLVCPTTYAESVESSRKNGTTTAQRNVSGQVTDTNGQPLPGVTVKIKDTSESTKTDNEGAYSLTVDGNAATLEFRFIGYITKEVAVANDGRINVQLAEDLTALDEVVVVGYGTQKRKDLTGSISTVKGADVMQPSAASFDQMLQGKIPGVQVTQTTGSPGGNVNILIRGISSITGGNQPLYVIDGFPIGSGGGGASMSSYGGNLFSANGMANNTSTRINPLSSINPADIESIDVLKDAAATAIYGSRGANGVVIITTKRGAAGKSEINVDVSQGFQEVAHQLDLMDARQYADYVVDARDNAWIFAGGSKTDPNEVRTASTRIPDGFRDPATLTTNTDWQDVIFRVAPVRNVQVSSMGGNDKLKYVVAGGYFDQEGIIINSNFERYNLRVNVDAQLNKWLKIGSSTYGSFGFGRFANTESHYAHGGVIANVLATSPTLPVYDENGDPYFSQQAVTDGLGFLANVLDVSNGTEDYRKNWDVFTNNYLEVKLTSDLTFKSTFGVNYGSNAMRLWRSSAVPFSTNLNYPATAGATKIESFNWLNENTLTYSKVIGEKHSLDGLVGFTAQKSNYERLSAGASNFATEYIPYISAGVISSGTHLTSEWSLLSLMARVNYSYAGKYLVAATIRQDGSSRFGENNKWGAFPSFSVGYNVSEEAFMDDLSVISNLKLRASYGVSGNNSIGDYTHLGLLSTDRYLLANALVQGLVPSSLPNDDLTWEKSKQTNFGVDLGLFQNRVNLTADIYRNLKTDLLLAVQLPAASGFNSSVQNIGDIENKGIELALNSTNVRINNFEWTSNITFSANRNKVLKLAVDGGRISNSNWQITEVGSPISSFYLINKLGIFMNSAELEGAALYHPATEPGDIKFEDVNNDGKVDQSDRKIVGTPWPDFVWGFDNGFRISRFSMNVAITGSQGGYSYIQWEGFIGSNGVQNGWALQDRRWRSEADPGDGVMPRSIRSNHANGFGASSHFLFSNSYTRIRNVSLAYDFPEKLTSRMRLQNLNVYFNISNLYTFTDYPGYDPEAGTTGDAITTAGIDYINYPIPRTYTMGIKVQF